MLQYMVQISKEYLGCLIILCYLLPFADSVGLYFPQKEYSEIVYVGQAAGTSVLQVHSMLESDSERPHFYFCWTTSLRPPRYAPWFNLDVSTGILSMNKTLEWSDFASICKLQKKHVFSFKLFIEYAMKLTMCTICSIIQYSKY